jgi:predicted RND superfamily exporter protein
VLADFQSEALNIVNELLDSNYKIDDITDYYIQRLLPCDNLKNRFYEILNSSNIVLNLKPFEEAIEGFNKLKEIAINYFDVPEEDTKTMLKNDLCKIIRKKLKEIDTQEIEEDPDRGDKEHFKYGKDTGSEYSMIFPHDFNMCKETPNRGGLTRKELKKIAIENFGLSTEHKNKDEICDDIEKKMKTKHTPTKVKDIITNNAKIKPILKYDEDDDDDDDDDDEKTESTKLTSLIDKAHNDEI